MSKKGDEFFLHNRNANARLTLVNRKSSGGSATYSMLKNKKRSVMYIEGVLLDLLSYIISIVKENFYKKVIDKIEHLFYCIYRTNVQGKGEENG